ncbi:hypothetical protein KUW15_03940 [Qipengyuania aquimaris]|uniref:hypothetical protein n=1 Tax=Qipengyuania aquimaris TaxID=255984 RepID=UPI001C95E23F|nr:hypothetical protein [Qipengyuania aquimaris]MBY6127861.1 hypothetical protein [Qipengyuania aquimaris]
MATLETHLEAAASIATAAITAVDGNFAAAPVPPDPTGKSAGQLMQAIASVGHVEPKQEVKRIRAKFYSGIHKAKAQLTEAEATMLAWEVVAKFLRGKPCNIEQLPAHMTAQAKMVKAAADAGLADATAVADQIDHAMGNVRPRLAQAELHLRQLEATGTLACVNQTGEYYARCGASYEHWQHGAEKRAARLRRARAERNRLAKAAKRKLAGKAPRKPKPKPRVNPTLKPKKRATGMQGERLA